MLESVLPLAKYIAEEGNEVHVFATLPSPNQNAYVIDFNSNRQPKGFIPSNVIAQQAGSKLWAYISGIRLNFFIFSAGVGVKAFLPDIYYAWKLSQHLKKNKYDVINLVHFSGRFYACLLFFLRKENVVQTLHEVTAHTGKTSNYVLAALKQLINYNIPVIFHSDVSKNRFIEFRKAFSKADAINSLYTTIPFGLYETYLNFVPADNKSKPSLSGDKKYTVLHFGRIVPYKGIDILIEAVKIAQSTVPVHLVIAGSGKPYFDFDGINSYEFINKELTNEEIVNLIQDCSVVVCPYKSASQSGIPVTVYPFYKPIIASNQGGFAEIIDHNSTGLIVQELTPEALANCIIKLASNQEVATQMALNIKTKFAQGVYNWSNIAKKTLSFYRNNLPKV